MISFNTSPTLPAIDRPKRRALRRGEARQWVRACAQRGSRAGRRTLAVLVVLLLAASAGAEERPPVLRGIGIEQRLDQQLPADLVFRDESGRSVSLGEYFGKRAVILSLAYYECPMLCTLVLNGLASALSTLSLEPGTDFEILTVSINPAEGPELAAAKKQNYVQRYGRPAAAAAWHFLTGEASSIERLADAVGFRYRYVPEQKQFAHAAGIMVLTREGKVARYLFGVEFAPRDLRLALVDASAGRIGTVVDEILLFCLEYDPTTGKYGRIAMRAVRAGGALTVLALGGFIVLMRWRESHGGGQG